VPADLDRDGGKGAQTQRLVDLGLPVPPSAVVPTSAYRAFAAQPPVADLVARIRAGWDVDAAAVDAAFLAAPVPPDVAELVRDLGAAVGDRIAVRSSATVEDLGGTSFAGQYRSLLDITPEELLRSVVLVWASLWHPAPCAYRRAHGIDDADVAMGVLLMRMVAARQSGVAFTVDPTGPPGSIRVEAVDGAGEALVSGAVTPRCWSLPRDDLGDAPPVVAEAAALALRVEAGFGVPVDVEWTWDGTTTWVVQARPITVAAWDGFDTPVDDHELTTAGIVEMLPGVLPPLVWQVAGTAVEEAFRASFDVVAGLPSTGDPAPIVRRVRGRAAVDLDGIRAVAARLPGSSAESVEHGYFGGEPPPSPPRARWWRVARHDLRVDAGRRRAQHEADVVALAVSALGAARTGLAGLDHAELLARHRRLLHLALRAMAAELGVAAAATAACDQVSGFVGGHLPADEAAHAARRALTGVDVATPPSWASAAVLGGPTWEELGTTPVALPVDQGAAEAAQQALEERLRSLPRWRTTRIVTGQVVDVRLHLLRRLVAEARLLLGRRERAKVSVLAVGGLLRAIHLELGERLVGAGGLDAVEDVDLLSVAELRGAAPLPGAAVVARRRRMLRRAADAGPLPERFRGVPEPERVVLPEGDLLTGLAASGGRATGRARVVRDPRHARFRPGEVLVAGSTDASWSPLFLDAAAIVVERGGPLSHAAIVARELGIPAVLDVAGATSLLAGRVVTVDGDAGVVAWAAPEDVP
jgi:pyruvate,water dikinase